MSELTNNPIDTKRKPTAGDKNRARDLPGESGSDPRDAGHPPAAAQPDDSSLDGAVEEAIRGITDADIARTLTGASGETVSPDEILTGRIANIGSKDVLIDFGGKSLGAMPLAEFDADEKYELGDAIEVMITGEDPLTGLLRLSRRKARQAALLRQLNVGAVVEGVVTGMNKGGLEVDIHGLRGFVPASQVDLHFMKDISELIGQTIRAVVIEFDPHGPILVLSRRKAQMQEMEERRSRAFDELALGQVRRGRIKSITEYGAFVDLGGVDGLLHVTDLSWGRVNRPEDVVKVGDEVDVKIIKLNRQARKVSLSLKEAIPHPWQSAAEKYPLGTTVTGRVVRLQPFGAFVELEPGLDALLPVSEMSWTRRLRHPSEMLREGDAVQAAVAAIDAEKRRISLSIKALSQDPWSSVAVRYPVGSTFKAKVVRTADFGAFVALEDGIDGLIHISELSEQRVKAVTDKVKVGDEVEVRVLAVDPAAKKVSLSMRKPPPPPSPEELARQQREREAAEKRREKSKSRRGGITFGWDQGFGQLDPSKYARS